MTAHSSLVTGKKELHGVPVAVAANRALLAVLDQFTPVLRRAERLRCSSSGGRASLARDELVRLCAAGDSGPAAAVAFGTWHTLPTTED